MFGKSIIFVAIVTAACMVACVPESATAPAGLDLESASGATATSRPATKPTIVVEAAPTQPDAKILPMGAEAGSPEALSKLAVQDLATRLSVAKSAIAVTRVTSHTFGDASLGVQQPGQMYAQVLTPGYILSLQADDKAYTYHGAGSRVVYAGADAQPTNKHPVPSSLPAPREGDLVSIYFGHTGRAASDCALVFAVTRESEDAAVAAGGLGPAEMALRALLTGPTEDELALGYSSPFSTATAETLISLSVDANTAYVNLRDIRSVVVLDDACARMQLQQQVQRTLQGVLPVERVLVALDGDPAAWCDWLNLPCASQGECDPAPFQPTRIPLRQAYPTIPPAPAPVLDLDAALPDEAEIVRQASQDLDSDGSAEVVVLVGQRANGDAMAYDWLKLMVVLPGAEPKVLWQMRTMGHRAMGLEFMDINLDGQMEVLSLQSMGASGQTLYVLTWHNGTYELLRPQGGYFAGWDSFGEKGVGYEDLTGDGVNEIMAAYGPAASKRDVYQWDGTRYVYVATQDYTVQ